MLVTGVPCIEAYHCWTDSLSRKSLSPEQASHELRPGPRASDRSVGRARQPGILGLSGLGAARGKRRRCSDPALRAEKPGDTRASARPPGCEHLDSPPKLELGRRGRQAASATHHAPLGHRQVRLWLTSRLPDATLLNSRRRKGGLGPRGKAKFF